MTAYFNRSLLAGILAVCFSLAGMAARKTAVAEVDSTNLLMGLTTRLTVSVEKPADGVKIVFPLLDKGKDRQFIGLLNDTIELSQVKVDTALNQGKEFVNYNFILQAFDSGKYVLPPFELILGNDTAYTNTVNLNVIPVKVKADDQIDPFSDVAEPFEVTLADGENKEKGFWDKLVDYWWIIALIILFIGVIIYGYVRYRKTGSILPVKRPIPPFEAAIQAMNKLREKKLWENGKEKEYFTSLTDILRVYLHKQYNINAMEMTSRQILKAMKKDGVLRQYRDLVRPVLSLSELVKFARQKPVADENVEVFDKVMQFLIQTRPIEEESEKKGGAK